MKISVPMEIAPRELRVAITPDSVARLIKQQKLEVAIQSGAGLRAGFRDDVYAAAGASIVPDAASLYSSATAVAKVQPPTPEEIARIPQGITLISLMRPGQSADIVGALAQRKITSLALELVPRITRAQSMDVLSSQSTVAGYKGVLIGAAALPKFLPMLTTAAGNISPAKVFVIGAGVAGLQAIATARRLGGVVSAFDVRPAAREQVMSLGAAFVATELVDTTAEAAGGYARAQTADEQTRTQTALANHIKDMDLVVTTAAIPGRPAPKLITAQMVESMRAGSVVVDLAAETGGNCALSQPGDTVVAYDVTIIAPLNVPSTVPFHASQMFARNILELLKVMVKDGALKLDADAEIIGAMTMTHDGKVLR
ncbi:MAG TPA: Re/Si-specific NAD(P)(+) transhydrogenase subunit alpha [Gemmatimonadaceae bacterium]|jgi:NAD(P) transhydrogenase subunit alpha|nr:Re/Si-specific NAD(P)(+) transhydrogenase subunit alpha [Gemmatimonadaceae bacterium]